MFCFLEQLFQEYDEKHGCHDESRPFCVKVDAGTNQSSCSDTGNPVQVIEHGYPERESAFIYLVKDGSRIVERKGFIAHPVNLRKRIPWQKWCVIILLN